MQHFILDSSICLTLFFDNEPFQNKKAVHFFKQVEAQNCKADISIVIINEIIELLEKLYKLHRCDFVSELCDLISFRGVRVVDLKKSDCLEVLRRYGKCSFSFSNCYLIWLAEKQQIRLASTNRRLENYCTSSSKQ